MKNKIFNIVVFLVAFLLITPNLFSQACGEYAPESYAIIEKGDQCFLQIYWGDPSQENMPEMKCLDNVGPTDGSNCPHNNELLDLEVTFPGQEPMVLYHRGSNNCRGSIVLLTYDETVPNTYISIEPNEIFRDAIGYEYLYFSGNQTGGSSFSCMLPNALIPAPVELSFFEARAIDRVNTISWITASETNVELFELEKSNNGIEFNQVVGTVDAAGFSNSSKIYQLEDNFPGALTYYRLRSIDYDGYTMFSDVVVVERKGHYGDKFMTVYPVPLKNGEAFQVTYEARNSENIRLLIMDITGRRVYEEQLRLNKGVYTWNINLPNFDQSHLIVQVHSNSGVETELLPMLATH